MTFLYIKTLYPSISSSSSSSIGIHLRTTLHHMSLTIVHYFIILKALKKVFDVNGDGAMQFEEFRGIHNEDNVDEDCNDNYRDDGDVGDDYDNDDYDHDDYDVTLSPFVYVIICSNSIILIFIVAFIILSYYFLHNL